MIAFLGNVGSGDFIMLLILLLIVILPSWLVIEIIRWLRRH